MENKDNPNVWRRSAPSSKQYGFKFTNYNNLKDQNIIINNNFNLNKIIINNKNDTINTKDIINSKDNIKYKQKNNFSEFNTDFLFNEFNLLKYNKINVHQKKNIFSKNKNIKNNFILKEKELYKSNIPINNQIKIPKVNTNKINSNRNENFFLFKKHMKQEDKLKIYSQDEYYLKNLFELKNIYDLKFKKISSNSYYHNYLNAKNLHENLNLDLEMENKLLKEILYNINLIELKKKKYLSKINKMTEIIKLKRKIGNFKQYNPNINLKDKLKDVNDINYKKAANEYDLKLKINDEYLENEIDYYLNKYK